MRNEDDHTYLAYRAPHTAQRTTVMMKEDYHAASQLRLCKGRSKDLSLLTIQTHIQNLNGSDPLERVR